MPTFEDHFLKSGGQPIEWNGRRLLLMDRVPIPDPPALRIRLVSTASDWKQGIKLQFDGDLIINGKRISTTCFLWEDTMPDVVDIQFSGLGTELRVSNAWDTGNGTAESWHNGAAMEVLVSGDLRTYHCNDGVPDEDFDDLVFTVEATQNKRLDTNA